MGLKPILVQFFIVMGIGVAVGGLTGFGISYLTQRFDLPLVEQSLTLVSAYGTYIITEDLGGSGVIGVVTTGLILGNFGSRIGMNPRTRVIVTEFWEFLAFFVNSIVFLLIGDQVRFASLGDNLQVTAITVGTMIVIRALTIFVLGGLSNRLVNQISIPDQTVLWWGGLRGAVSIALALSVPTNLPDRETLIAIVFGAVLFTLLVQGLTIQPLLKGLQLLGEQPARQRYLEVFARQSALNRVLEHLSQVEQRQGIDPEFCRYQETLIRGKLEFLELEIDKLQDEYPDLQDFIMEQLRQELLSVEANTYAEFVRNGRLNRELSSFFQEVIDNR